MIKSFCLGRVRSEWTTREIPNSDQKAKEIMKRVKELQKGMRFTDGSKTQEILRAARGGAMFGGELDE